MVMDVAKIITIVKDGVIGIVAGAAAIIYGYTDYRASTQNQEKAFVEQFGAAIGQYKPPESCNAIDMKQAAYLEIAMSAAAKLEKDFKKAKFGEVGLRLSSAYSEFEAGCAVNRAAAAGALSENDATAILERALSRSNVRLQEAAVPAESSAQWFKVAATFPIRDVDKARQLVCGWTAHPELKNWRFDIYETIHSRSIAVVIDGPVDFGEAIQAVQLIRNNPKQAPFFGDAFAQANRNWRQKNEKFSCPGVAEEPPTASRITGASKG